MTEELSAIWQPPVHCMGVRRRYVEDSDDSDVMWAPGSRVGARALGWIPSVAPRSGKTVYGNSQHEHRWHLAVRRSRRVGVGVVLVVL